MDGLFNTHKRIGIIQNVGCKIYENKHCGDLNVF
jgi:hypothetical protein